MSDKIRIKSIFLENYRQYYGETKINFSTRDEGFTVIAGKNGEGKSNLLNAISWCLYHQEPHGMKDNIGHDENRSLPVINSRYIIELGEKKLGKTSVKILIEKGDTTYSISRILTVLKHELEFKELENDKSVLQIAHGADDIIPRGCEIISEQGGFVIKEKRSTDADFRDTKDDIMPEVLMDEILPEGLSKYFLLDGEFLEGFWQDPSIIKKGVEQISQLHLLRSLKDHVSEMCMVPKGTDKDVNSLNTRIEALTNYDKSNGEDGIEKYSSELRWNDSDTYYHASGTPRMREIEDDCAKMKQAISDLTKKIGATGSINIKHLKNEKIRIELEIENAREELEGIEKEYRYNLIAKSPYIFLKNAIEYTVATTEKRTEVGDLPIRQRRQFAEDLLNRKICICGENLDGDDGDPATKTRIDTIARYKDKELGKDDLDAAVDMKYDFKHEFLEDYTGFLKKTFGEPEQNLARKNQYIDKLEYELQGINQNLKNFGGEEVEKLIESQEDLINQRQEKMDQRSEIKSRLRDNGKELSKLRVELDKKLKQNKKMKRISHAYSVWTGIQKDVKNAYDELKENIRMDVQNSTWKNFKELLSNPSEFQSFTIGPDYSVYLLDVHNTNKIYDLSAGQSLILTLAFVAALRKHTGYRFPLVVDSPLGKIDSGNRYNIGIHLPDYLPDEQLTLLVTDTEYVASLPPDVAYPNMPQTSVAKLLENKIGLKHFKITKETSGSNVGNSRINLAKLKLEKESKTWVVSTDV